MNGKLYGVGVGPGDPELLTIKAKKILETVDYICTPQSGKQKKSIALTIVKDIVDCHGKIKKINFPMTSKRAELITSWNKATDQIVSLLNENYNIAFITLGDPLLYSTYNYILKKLKNYKDVNVETIPGINSISAGVARLNLPLSEGNDRVIFFPLTSEVQELEKILNLNENIVFMKVSRNYDLLLSKLRKYGLMQSSYLISRCGQEDEFISTDLASFSVEEIPYLSLVITKKKEDDLNE